MRLTESTVLVNVDRVGVHELASVYAKRLMLSDTYRRIIKENDYDAMSIGLDLTKALFDSVVDVLNTGRYTTLFLSVLKQYFGKELSVADEFLMPLCLDHHFSIIHNVHVRKLKKEDQAYRDNEDRYVEYIKVTNPYSIQIWRQVFIEPRMLEYNVKMCGEKLHYGGFFG